MLAVHYTNTLNPVGECFLFEAVSVIPDCRAKAWFPRQSIIRAAVWSVNCYSYHLSACMLHISSLATHHPHHPCSASIMSCKHHCSQNTPQNTFHTTPRKNPSETPLKGHFMKQGGAGCWRTSRLFSNPKPLHAVKKGRWLHRLGLRLD
jgi:hypothetical protein